MKTKHCILLQAILFAIMVVVLSTTSVFAQQVNEQQARTRAVEFITEINGINSYSLKAKKFRIKNAEDLNARLNLVYVSGVQDDVYFYVFNNPEGGWVMVSGNDVTEDDVIAYSYEGSFKYDGAPDNLKNWLKKYEAEIKFAVAQSAVQGQYSMTSGLRKAAGVKKADKVDVETLVQSHWDQDTPYWNMCPMKNSTRCLTGCVATAMAQVMRYWKWPVKGTGSKTYTDTPDSDGWGTGQTLTANFGEHTYLWDSMPYETSSYTTTTQKNAVAQLMSDCGISVEMTYGTSSEGGSGAYSENIPTALTNYFGYKSSAKYYSTSSPNNTTWKNRVYTELAAGRPVLYDGYSSNSGGHEFVCDGYQASTGKYHFNWGWSGECDGYFSIGTLNPSGYNFSSEEGCVIGVEPDGQSFNVTAVYDDSKGEVLVDEEVAQGATATIVVGANDGYKLTDISVKGDDSKANISFTPAVSAFVDEYSFTMPEENVTVTVTFGVAEQYTITWMSTGNVYTSTQVTEGHSLALPADPTAPEGYVFRGWTQQSSVNSDGTDITYVTDETIPTESATYYAVYAVANGSGGTTDETLSFSYADHDGWTVTGEDKTSYYLLNSGKSITSPTITCSSITSITTSIRTFGGSTYNTLNVSFAGNEIGTATASSNKLGTTTFTLTNKAGGTGQFVFSSTTTTSANGPGVGSITINYKAESTTYSDYTLNPSVEPTPTPTPVYYTVTWNDNDVETSQQVEGGTGLVLPTTPTAPTDYSFCGWSVTKIDDNVTVAPQFVTEGTIINADVTYYAVYSYIVGEGTAEETTSTTTFTSNSWDDADDAWESGTAGNQYTSGQGVQITTATTGAYATSRTSFSNVTQITVNYCTNSKNGVGAIKVKVGDGTEQSFSVTKPSSGGTTLKDAEFNFSPSESGIVKLSVDCTTNSIYINAISITSSSSGGSVTYYTLHPETDTPPTPVVIPTYSIQFVDKGNEYQTVVVDSATLLIDAISQVTVPQNDDTNYLGYEFVGWSLNNSTLSPTFVTSADLVRDNVVVYAIYQTEGSGTAGWTCVNSVAVGDSVLIAEIDDGTKELSGISSTSTPYGLGTDFTTLPVGTMTYSVVEGTQTNTYAFFNNSTNKYLSWSSGNSLTENAALSDNTSWRVNEVSERCNITNYVEDGSSERVIYWACSSNGGTTQKFACYKGKSHGMNDTYNYYYYPVIYKYVPGSGDVQYSLEIPPVPVQNTLSGLEVPAVMTDGTTILVDHTTKIDGNDVRTYCYEFDKSAYHTRWVAFRFDDVTRETGSGRNDSFRDDPDISSDYWITNNTFGTHTLDSKSYSLSRGHICASNDRQYSVEANKQTFYMTNMTPMIQNKFNSGYWSSLEAQVQTLGRDESFSDTLYVVKGGTVSSDKIYGTIERTYNGETRNMVIPKYYYVALLRVKKDAQKGEGYKAIGFLLKHQEYNTGKFTDYPEHVVSIDSLEKFTGIDFFPGLPDDVENAIEGITVTNNVRNDWGFSQTASTDEYPFIYHNTTSEVTTTDIDDYAYATFYNDNAKIIPEGISAYIATTSSTSETVNMLRLEEGIIPSSCGVVLRSDMGDSFEFVDAETDSQEDVSNNLLVGWTYDNIIAGSNDVAFYALNYETVNDTKNVGFFAPKGSDNNPNGTFTAKAGKAYLRLNGQNSKKITMNFGDVPTWIDEPQEKRNDKTQYNLSGQRVDETYKGLIIMKGKKVIKK